MAGQGFPLPQCFHAEVAGDAGCPVSVAALPVIDQMRFPDQGAAERGEIGISPADNLLDQFEGTEPPHQEDGNGTLFLISRDQCR